MHSNKLVNSNSELHAKVVEYQKSLSEKEDTIRQFTDQVDKLNESTGEYQRGLSEKEETINRLTARIDSQKVIAFEPLTDEEKETIPQVIPRTDSSDVIVQVKSLYNKGKYDKGEEMLKKAIQLGLPDGDKAWAFHNLGVSSLRKKDYEKARELLEKAVGLSPNMEESQKTLDSIDDLQRKEKQGKD